MNRIAIGGNNPQQTRDELTHATGAVFLGSPLQRYVDVYLFEGLFYGRKEETRKNK